MGIGKGREGAVEDRVGEGWRGKDGMGRRGP